MNKLLLLLLLTVAHYAASTDRPVGMDDAYAKSLDPSEQNGYSNSSSRAGAYWPLDFHSTTNSFPGLNPLNGLGRAAPPAARYFGASELVRLAEDVGAHERVLVGADSGDVAVASASVRFTGADGSCLKVDGFSGSVDACLQHPSRCSLKDPDRDNATGFSLSLWVNLPQTFDTQPRYILHTGGDEFGSPGIAVYFTGSTDGRRFSHQITVLVSTGNQFWKVALSGMTKPYAWNNIGVRWSANSGSELSAVPLGLQVFVNKTSVAWKRYPTVDASSGSSSAGSDLRLTIGCRRDGKRALIGRVDNLAIWYWRLSDLSVDHKPTVSSDYGQIEYLDGGLVFNETSPILHELGWQTTGDLLEEGIVPPFYAEEMRRVYGWGAASPYDDVSPALEGNCEPTDINSHGSGGADGLRHVLDCVDTITELQAALANYTTQNFEGTELVLALVRVLNKAGAAGVDAAHMAYLNSTALPLLMSKLLDETTLNHARISASDPEPSGVVYASFAFFLSKLQDLQPYEAFWNTEQVSRRSPGITSAMRLLEQLLLAVAARISRGAVIHVGSNHTAVVALNTVTDDVGSAFIFPDYHLINFYEFPVLRKETWGPVNDWIRIPQGLVHVGYKRQRAEYGAPLPVQIVATLYNHMAEHIPAYLDERVTGTDGQRFFVNSRVLSASLQPAVEDSFMLSMHPVSFLVAHRQSQPEEPYLKGAVLCVRWNHNQIDPRRSGAWDTQSCSVVKTNDTHTTCACTHLSDFAVLTQVHQPVGRVSDGGYTATRILYGVSILCLLLFVAIIQHNPFAPPTRSTRIRAFSTLHYELHIVHMNVAIAMAMALGFYLLTLLVHRDRIGCLVVSVFMHLTFTASYLWFAIASHYVFRAITKGALGGRILTHYSFCGWGLPTLFVAVLVAVDVTNYGIGEHCLGTHRNYFLWLYIGVFVFLCAAVLPLFVISICNVYSMDIKDPEDRADITWSLYGTLAYWPVIMAVWVMAALVYLLPQENQIFDFLFELFNSVQGILIFIFFGIFVPSFREALTSCGRKRRNTKSERMKRRRKLYVEYIG